MTNSAVRILVVDDEPPIRKLLRIGLTVEGYAILEAINAMEAMEKVETEQPDLILLDLGLPDIQGHDLLARWRNDLLELPIIILSSRTDEAGIVKALDFPEDELCLGCVTGTYPVHVPGEKHRDGTTTPGDPPEDIVCC